jgi:nucleoside-diphosphate-sugar epimerase
MKCLVTGSAGFIGSHLCDELLRQGNDVIGIDALIPYYDPAIKRGNCAGACRQPLFQQHVLDLRQEPCEHLLAEVEVVFHLAAMPGLPRSWTDFEGYWSCNVLATQKLLEAIRQSGSSLRCLIYASTSSVYGRFGSGDESLPTKPISPYGVTKLAAEHLCRSYSEAYDIPLTVLRYFSVYGPRQRPDMGYFRFIDGLLREKEVVVFGDGQQVRGNTYVDDCVQATVAAAAGRPGEIYNVGGGEAASVWDILRQLEALSGRTLRIRRETARPGDQRYTFADTTRLRNHLGWEPRVSLEEGLARQIKWQMRGS